LGETPFVKMVRGASLSTQCKMCAAPYTQFSWKAGKGLFNKTEVCGSCSVVKNLCQCCLKDLKYGLPAALRDSVLHHMGVGGAGVAPSNTSDFQQRYHMQQQLQLVEAGRTDLTEGHDASDRLLRIARAAADQREATRLKHAISSVSVAAKRQREQEEKPASSSSHPSGDDQGFNFLLPEGYEKEQTQTKEGAVSVKKKTKKAKAPPPPPPGPPPSSAFEK